MDVAGDTSDVQGRRPPLLERPAAGLAWPLSMA